jgi:hypothetical protein
MTTTLTAPEVELIATELAESQFNTQSLRRNGKIARLPKEIRHMLNRMLDDGLPYHVIIDELGDAGRGLNNQNITNWVQGGYQDYLKHQDAIDRAKAIVEAVVDLLRENGDADLAQVRRACNYVASLQLFEALREHGDETLKKLFQVTPSKYLNIVHTLCHLSNSALKVEKHHFQQDLLAARTAIAPPSSPIKVNQAPAEISPELQLNSGTTPPQQSTTLTPPAAPPSSQIKLNQAEAEISPELQLSPRHYATPTLAHSDTATRPAIKPNQGKSSPNKNFA